MRACYTRRLAGIEHNRITQSCEHCSLAGRPLLARAKLFVMNGGMGGARESAWFGIPMLAIPTTFETDIISTRIQQQGAGIRRSVDTPAAGLRAAEQWIGEQTKFWNSRADALEARLARKRQGGKR